MRDCLAVGVGGRGTSAGYFWTEGDSPTETPSFWDFEDCVSLACRMFGVATWQNTSTHHEIASAGKFISINCGTGGPESGGITHGAYNNPYVYQDCDLYQFGNTEGIDMWAVGSSFQRIKVVGGKHAIRFMHHTLTTTRPTLIKNWTMQGQSGKPILVTERGSAGSTSQHNNWDIVNCGLNISNPLSNFENFASGIAPGSVIRMQEGNVAKRIDSNGNVTTIPLFA